MIPIPERYRTKRLVARPYENTPGDMAFLSTQIDDDPTNAALNIPSLAEQERQGTDERVTEGVLFMSFCLPEETVTTTSTTTDTTRAAPADRFLEVQEFRNRLNSLTPIGLLYVRQADPPADARKPHDSVEIGVTLATAYQDESYAAEMVHWALYWAFRHGEYHSVRAKSASPPDGPSFAGLGFVEEGREADYFADGSGREVVSYRMLRRDWKAPEKSRNAPYVQESIEAGWECEAQWECEVLGHVVM